MREHGFLKFAGNVAEVAQVLADIADFAASEIDVVVTSAMATDAKRRKWRAKVARCTSAWCAQHARNRCEGYGGASGARRPTFATRLSDGTLARLGGWASSPSLSLSLSLSLSRARNAQVRRFRRRRSERVGAGAGIAVVP